MVSKSTVAEQLYAPLNVITSLLSTEELNTERSRQINVAMMADILGDSPIAPPPSNLSREETDLLHAILALYSCVDRFAVFKSMFSRYPWRGTISKVAHLESTFYLLAHETYILEERLKAYFTSIQEVAESKTIVINASNIRKSILTLHKKSFGNIVRLRGSHVHKEEVAPREIKRVRLLDTLKKSENPEYKRLYNSAWKDARAEWIKNSEVASSSAQLIAATAFNLTKPVWKTLTAPR